MLYPLTFDPIFKERVWGSESWTISDRAGDDSRITNGSLAGRTLHDLLESDPSGVLGAAARSASGRFPILCKILTCNETLSVQVHPPAVRAAALGGEPKTEMWYIADAAPGAELYVGLRQGVTRDEFERRLRRGDVEAVLHRIPVRRGDSMFLPSGRVHAIGAGLVIFEIQQNSDTTYRVFDWNRPGLDGKPRDLHIDESMASIDFEDYEPALTGSALSARGTLASSTLVRDPLFNVDLLRGPGAVTLEPGRMHIVAAVEGAVEIRAAGSSALTLPERGFCLLPAALGETQLSADGAFLLVEGEGSRR